MSSPLRKKPKNNLPTETVDYLKAWMMSPEYIAHPYPTEEEKRTIMNETGIGAKQLTNWFVNNRKRFWKPQVEALKKEEQNGNTSTTEEAITTSPTPQVSPPPAVSSSMNGQHQPLSTKELLDINVIVAAATEHCSPPKNTTTGPQQQQSIENEEEDEDVYTILFDQEREE